MKTVVVHKAVLFRDGKLLAIRRSKTDVRRPFQWDLPGGVNEEDEELVAGVKREALEETGLNVKKTKPVYAVTKIKKWTDEQGKHAENVVYLFFLAESREGDIKLSYEHAEYQWMTIEEALDLFEYDLHKELLIHIRDNNLLEV